MRAARSDEELDRRIYAMGDFGRIMNVAKRRVAFRNLFDINSSCQQARNGLVCYSPVPRSTGSSIHVMSWTSETSSLATSCFLTDAA